MPIQWNTIEQKDKLLAAFLASLGDKPKPDYRLMATYFGEGATYDAIEGQFRKIRPVADQMRKDFVAGAINEAPQRGGRLHKARGGTTDSTGTPCPRRRASRKKMTSGISNSVISGRVTKSISPREQNQYKQNQISARQNAVCGFKEEVVSTDISNAATPLEYNAFDGTDRGEFDDILISYHRVQCDNHWSDEV